MRRPITRTRAVTAFYLMLDLPDAYIILITPRHFSAFSYFGIFVKGKESKNPTDW